MGWFGADPYPDKVAVITGAASGIGRALAAELVRRGADVVLADIDAQGAETAAAALREAGGRAEAVALDVTDAAAVEALVADVDRTRGRLDYLFNNAAIAVIGEVQELDLEDWYRVLDVNLRGVIHGVHAAYRRMVRQGHGHIVNTASIAGLGPGVNEIPYSASKHAIIGLSTSLRAEAADLGVKVSVVCPGFVDTPGLYEHLIQKVPGAHPFASRDHVKRAMPVRILPPDKAARAILRGVARNQQFITFPLHAKAHWWMNRSSVGLGAFIARFAIRGLRKQRSERA